ncbi:phosphoribosylaminoimidazolesuccinocarboxamide synthase [cf. Phormidesmis sp. LEGE 11477]|uniref:phosphoribosylaminoimidazolesuccinocarboxamide synthase n=1 Tax=cf. Phormidesmis sp. LEGE 11477 TaxID=1828680 RepID=UPI00187E6287|nr:phosphoribosylaminoimidazolesuccinocarboxamide synthase [cf. Phormidesmis sp. LEGE 11477]MBE9060917.1 phosphoribosylaminoimidazolesuccinocarboxamide synthase [cf. Phormidesmis sp. LEGE 11477]
MKLTPFAFIGTSLLTWALTMTSAMANCSDRPASTEWYGPVMAAHFQQISTNPLYPEPGVFDRIEGSDIYLTDRFDALRGDRKRYVIGSLLRPDFSDYLTSEELEAKYQGPGSEGIGTWPYDIVASDGRNVLEVYDGCTTFTLLTERDRFNLYFSRYYESNRDTSQGEMRNAGQPSWRQVNFSITAEAEKAVRLGFWNSVGYDSQGWWIAWVPEQGHFEVIVPRNFDYEKLQRYWLVADQRYRYVVVREDGTQLGIKEL